MKCRQALTHERSEAAGIVRQRAGVHAVPTDIGEAIQETSARNADVCEGNPSIIDAVEAHFNTAVANGHPGKDLAELVSQRNQERVNAMVATFGDELGEHDRDVGSFYTATSAKVHG